MKQLKLFVAFLRQTGRGWMALLEASAIVICLLGIAANPLTWFNVLLVAIITLNVGWFYLVYEQFTLLLKRARRRELVALIQNDDVKLLYPDVIVKPIETNGPSGTVFYEIQYKDEAS